MLIFGVLEAMRSCLLLRIRCKASSMTAEEFSSQDILIPDKFTCQIERNFAILLLSNCTTVFSFKSARNQARL